MLTRNPTITLSPDFSIWKTLVASALGELFGKPLESWQVATRQALGIPQDKPIVLVGHQPTLFHPGILAKFIAADRLAKEIDGVLVYLVVDHHKGDVGALETPKQELKVATIDPEKAMSDQLRVEVEKDIEPFTSALQIAEGETAAMQFANALVQLMSPWANVQHVITASELVQSEFGHAVVSEMQLHPQYCIKTYNSAVNTFPGCDIPLLQVDELPLWKTKNTLHPRALLLTLLARLVACDLFVHGTGGIKYDHAMEGWCHAWLGCTPCNAVMATATLYLEMEFKTVTDARREFYTPSFDRQTKMGFLKSIEDAPSKSPQKQVQFQKMHHWLHSVQAPLDLMTLKREEERAKKRDWSFPLYTNRQLNTLYESIYAL